MLWVNGVNIVNQGPDCREIARAFASVPFTVVVGLREPESPKGMVNMAPTAASLMRRGPKVSTGDGPKSRRPMCRSNAALWPAARQSVSVKTKSCVSRFRIGFSW